VLTSAEPTQDATPTEANDAALMDCMQTATLADWNPNQPCSAYEMPKKATKAKAEKEPTIVAELTPAKPAEPKKVIKTAAAKPASKPKPTQIASAKAPQKPAKKKKKKKHVDDGGSCVQGASTIADWNPNLPCASGETAARLKLVDVPPAL